MSLFGDKNSFAMEVSKDKYAYQLSLFIEGKDILQFEIKGGVYPHRWSDFDDIIEWFEENMEHILSEEPLSIMVSGNSTVERYKNCYKSELKISEAEMLSDWSFRHSWFSAREGAFLAGVIFQNVNEKVEISWDNTELFKQEGVRYIFPKGRYEIDKEQFEKIVEEFCLAYKQLRIEASNTNQSKA